MKSRRRLTASILASAFILFAGANEARADLFGIDLGPLTTLVGSAAEQIVQLAEIIATLRASYEEAKRVAGYADDAARAFKDFENLADDLFHGRYQGHLEAAFPDLAYFRNEMSHTGPWAVGTGELQRTVRQCVTTGNCYETKLALDLKTAREALSGTFGTVPHVAGSIEAQAMDHEAAVAMAASSAQVGRDAQARAQARALMKECAKGGKDKNLAACQAAGAAAAILGAEQNADIADQLAEANRLQAARVAQENGRRKREINEAVERRQAILAATRDMAPPAVTVKTQGVVMLDGNDR